MAALAAIDDPNVRQVLQALVDAHHVRNGASGNGDNRFITAAEARMTGGHTGISSANSQPANNPPPGSLIRPADIARIINDLQALVIESPLFKVLGERVDLIDKPGGIFTRLGNVEVVVTNEITTRATADEAEIAARTALGVRVGLAEGAILTEFNARVTAENAIVLSITTQFASVNSNLALVQGSVSTVANTVAAQATQISQVQASVAGNSAAIQQVSQASADADGVINAKYTVKIDVNGYVSGYGLMSTANNATPFAEFIVRADRFAIGSPTGPGTGIVPKVPFIVLTTPTTIGGQVVPPGVYIDEAFIKNGVIDSAKIGNAAITSAKIGDAEVGTLKIAGASVTVGVYDSGGFVNVPASSGTINYVTLISRTVDLGDGYNTGVIVVGLAGVQAASNASYGLAIYINGAQVSLSGQSLHAGFTDNIVAIGFLPVTGRYATVELKVYNNASGAGSNVAAFVTNSNIAIFGGKR